MARAFIGAGRNGRGNSGAGYRWAVVVPSRTYMKMLKAMVNGFEAYKIHFSCIFNLCMLPSAYSVYT